MSSVSQQRIVKPGEHLSLANIDTRDTRGLKKTDGKAQLIETSSRLHELQELFYAAEKRSLLVILQGMDTSGKDGVIEHVMGACNPQGCQVTSFKVPTKEELAHDFLWRVHKATPRQGQIGIFNRSHYEDVLVVRVENLVPEKQWRARYKAINHFERLLAENGTLVLKFFLHMSKARQKERLLSRLEDPQDQWKFRVGDLDARAKWDEYTEAYEDALTRCSTKEAPWFVIPSDRKWYRNLLVSQIICEQLEALELEWPPLEKEAIGITIT